jgi:predicted helicase
LHVNSGSQDELRLTGESTHNICKVFAGKIARCIGLSARENDYLQVDDSAESIFAYVYATSSSPKFRLKYNDALKLDFPRIPLPGNRELYLRLSEIGKKLISIHLLEKEGEHSQVRVISAEGKLVEKPSWSNDTVWLDKEQTVGFTGIREEAWNFHVGGYQVCSKWLKDRKGMELTKDDIAHYLKVVAAINATIKLTVELDEVIDAHGGWPKAFQ